MKRLINLFIIILLISCSPDRCPDLVFDNLNKITTDINNNLYTGRCLTFEGENLRSVQQYLNGVDYGKWIFYFPNGNIQTKGRFNNYGRRVGTWKYFFENGQIKQKSRYSRTGERTGKWIIYNESGELIEEINY